MIDAAVVTQRLEGLLRYLDEADGDDIDYRWLRVELESLAKSLYRAAGN